MQRWKWLVRDCTGYANEGSRGTHTPAARVSDAAARVCGWRDPNF